MLDDFINKLENFSPLNEPELNQLIDLSKQIIIKEPNVLSLNTPISICGDIHGQFADLLELFRIGGYPSDTKYLFLGDYVDRGLHSVEVISYLLCLKLKYPGNISLIRGNHESRQITQVYGFYDECFRKYGTSNVWNMFMELFDLLPISATVDDKIFSCHGGLSPQLQTINDIHLLDRFIEVPHEGAMSDLLWSDPEIKPSSRGFGVSPRGAGWTFSEDITENWNKLNRINLTCRAHQLMLEGHSFSHNQQCLTLFTAPNYCGRCNNKATLMEVKETGDCELIDFISIGEELELKGRIPDYFL